jgi:quercetin dioxygenase-like cupin family protein
VKLARWDTERDGPPNEQALRRQLEARGYQVSRYVYPPGTHFPDHTHDVDKIDVVLSGRFRMTLGDASVVLEAGDSLEVPCGAVHSAEVVGDEPVVSLDATREAQ